MEGGFDMIQNHVYLLLGKVHAVPTRATVTAADAAEIICCMCLRSGDGFSDVLVADNDPGPRQEHGLVPHCRLGVPQEHQR
jgi:hypothetical protein